MASLTVSDLERAVPFHQTLLHSLEMVTLINRPDYFYCIGGRTGVAIAPASVDGAKHWGHRFLGQLEVSSGPSSSSFPLALSDPLLTYALSDRGHGSGHWLPSGDRYTVTTARNASTQPTSSGCQIERRTMPAAKMASTVSFPQLADVSRPPGSTRSCTPMIALPSAGATRRVYYRYCAQVGRTSSWRPRACS